MLKILLSLLLVLMPVTSNAGTTHQFFGPVHRYSLENGLNVLLKPVDHSRAFTAQIWVKAGSFYEDETNNGLSHLLEHMLFKGTEQFSSDEIKRVIESVGGRQNAATAKDYTKYYVTLPASHWKQSLKLLEQMSFHATLPEEEFKKERKVVLSELARYHDNPQRALWLTFIPKLYGNHPYGQLTIGSKSVLKTVTHDQLTSYYNRFYQPDNMTLVVSGQFDVEPVKKAIRKLYRDEVAGDTAPPDIPEMDRPSTESIERLSRPANQTYGLIGTTGVGFNSKKTVALDLLMELLGGGKDSRLYETLVIEKDLASQVSARYWTLKKPGPIMIRFQTKSDNPKTLIEAIKAEAEGLASGEISNDELERARTSIKTDFIYSAQTATGQANKLGYWETLGSIEYLETYLDQLNSVTKNDLHSLARRLLVEQRWTGAVIVPET